MYKSFGVVTELHRQMLVSMPHICPELFSTHVIG